MSDISEMFKIKNIMAYLEKQYFNSYYMVHTKDFENYECVNN